MAKLYNIDRQILLEINLLDNEYLDISQDREKYENWIPFELIITTVKDELRYSESHGATFSEFEIETLIQDLSALVLQKFAGQHIERYEYTNSENYFGLTLYDPLEEREIYLELWINMGSLTGGQIFGYDIGFRFVATVEDMSIFVDDLKSQLGGFYRTLHDE